MKITLIGSAGAFDFGETSSSFLLETSTRNVLIDCGHNVLKKLKEKGFMTLDKYIDTVFITHLHMDHIADLEGLIYYNYFILRKRSKIYIPNTLHSDFLKIFPEEKYSYEYQNKNEKIDCMYELLNTREINNKNDPIYLRPFEANHPGIKAYGYEIIKQAVQQDSDVCDRSLITAAIISGDSKANPKLLNITKEAINKHNYNSKPLYIFHDYSNWDDITRNVHCCSTDFNLFYKELLNGKNKDKIKFIHYHNGENVDLEIEI